MSRKSLGTLAIFTVFFGAGCNRQDADALSKIGQILVARAKALPIKGPQAKSTAPAPQPNENSDEPKKEEPN